MPYDNDTFRKYARLLLETGVNLQPGQCLAVMGEPVHWNFMVILAEEAYLAGARFVEIDAPHPRVLKARIDHAPAEHLDYVPGYRTTRYEEYVQDHWARIALTGPEDMDLFERADQKRNGKIQKAFREVAKPFMKACSAGEVPWCVAAVPTPAWAARIFDCEADEAACMRLWGLMEKVLRLDQPEPAAVWRTLAERMENRANVLNAYAFETYRFTAPGTDLVLHGLPGGSIWCGGRSPASTGDLYLPNIPTEEVFTAPAYRKSSGRAAVTRPVEVMGGTVHGAWFEFAGGRVVDFGAERGKEKLDAFFSIDDRGRYLGEMALVDSSSPIFQSGAVFHNILYDENAACHIALGVGYPQGVKGGESMSEEELDRIGINQSVLHTDFMIGCESMDVTGTTSDGREVPIIQQGTFTGEFA